MHGVQGVSAHSELHALESGRLRLCGRQGEDDGRDLRQRSHQVSSPGGAAAGMSPRSFSGLYSQGSRLPAAKRAFSGVEPSWPWAPRVVASEGQRVERPRLQRVLWAVGRLPAGRLTCRTISDYSASQSANSLPACSQLRDNGNRKDGELQRRHLRRVPGAELHQPRHFRGRLGRQRWDRVLDCQEFVG